MEYNINGRLYTLDETCGACPEQYDAYLDDQMVGYFRLRHGYFTVEVYCEDIWGDAYSAEPKGDGIFEPDEREYYLIEGLRSIDSLLHNTKDTT